MSTLLWESADGTDVQAVDFFCEDKDVDLVAAAFFAGCIGFFVGCIGFNCCVVLDFASGCFTSTVSSRSTARYACH